MKQFLFFTLLTLFLVPLQAQEPNDCVNAITVCGNGNFSSNATGIGNTQEVSGCGGFEHNSLWLEVNIVQSGTLGFDLIPNDPDIMVDYDFWVYGPNVNCGALGNPIRCATTNPNEANLHNNQTGINGSTTLTQTGPGANGNGYVFWLNVNVGESYYIVIDRPAGEGGFELQWTGTANEGTGAFPAPPSVNEIDDVVQCSSTPDIAVFNLDGLDSSINSDAGSDIDYYASLADAVDDINELPGIYANTSNPQTIYAKVKSGATDCYSLTEFDLVVSPIPDATLSVSDTAICEGDSITFTINGTPGATVSYNINGGATQQIVLDASGETTLVETPAADLTLNLENAQVLASDGTIICSQASVESETVTVTSVGIPVIVNNSPICEGEDGEIQLSGDANATITYTIDGGASQTLDLDTTGNFTLTFPTLTATTVIDFISVSSAAAPNCVLSINSTETITVNPLPTVIDLNPLLACNDGTNPNSAVFDLDAESAAISNNAIDVTVTYYETQPEAEIGNMADALMSPYDSTSANQTVFVRVETDLGCVNFATINLQVIDAPIANTPTNLQACDDANNGISVFDLTEAEAEIIVGNTQAVQVSYYMLEAEAEAGSPEITDPTVFENTVANNQIVYARVDSNGTDCFNIAPINLEVFDVPVLETVQPLEVCDDISNDGEAQFNLDSQTPLLLNGATDVTISYHASMNNAEDDTNPLTSPYTNTDSPQTIYVRAENNFNTECISISTFEILVTPVPFIVNPSPLEVCDDGIPDGITSIDLSLKNSEITANNSNYTVSYHISQADADNDANPLAIPYTNTVNGQIVFVRVEDINLGCFNTTTLELSVEQAPTANSPTPLEYCDPDSDGFGLFDLTSKDDEITGGDTTLSVSYHETMADADNNVNPISSPYNNIVINQQTIYVRVESNTIQTDCDTIITLELIVNSTPQLGAAPTPLEICDDATADGFGQFDLTSKNPEILQNLVDPTLYTVSFYINEVYAEMAMNPIAVPTNYTNNDDFNQIIWARVDDNATDCYKLTTLELIVNTIPILAQAPPLELCDENNPGDEVEEFVLEDINSTILNGQSGINISYFETQQDADDNTNPITSPYSNIANAQTIFVRAINEVTGCVNTTTFTIRVNPIPSPISPSDLEVCDDDEDGFVTFDLESKTDEIEGGELDIAITYHETLSDAQTGSNVLASPYTNIVANQQTIYVRATNTITGCFNATETLTIRVLETPQVPTVINNFTICDSDANGFAPFDLTVQDSEIIDDQTDVTLTYHVTEADAISGDNPISNPTGYTNNDNPQIIYVRLENDNNICFETGSFEISVSLPPAAVQPTPLELCDDDVADEMTGFDLTEKNDEITDGNGSWSVDYYETLADAESESNAINATDYTNMSVEGAVANPQTLFAVVTDTNTSCTDIVTLTIRVLPKPTPTEVLPDIILCDDNNTGDMQEEFDLSENETLLLNGEPNVSATYHETFLAAENGVDAIPDPTTYTNIENPQIIYVRVTNDNTGCFTVVDFNILVNPLPEVTAVTDFIQCELNTDGFDNFDLTTKNEEVLNGQNETLFTVTYHTTQQDADDVMNGIVSPFTNTSNPQQIFVAITNNETGCSVSAVSFNVEVQEAAAANSDAENIIFEVCNDEMDSDNNPSNNTTIFDLTTQDPEVLDGQNPTDYIVTYFASEMDANLNVNPLDNMYENIVNPQIIWARVDNNTLDGAGMDTSICFAVAPLTLQVNSIPQFTLEENYTLCLNINGTEVVDAPIINTGLSTAGYMFMWFFNDEEIIGATEGSYMPTQAGTYSVIVTDISTSLQTMCETEPISTVVIESSPPIISALVTTDAFANTHIIEVTLEQGNGQYEYSLDGGPWQDELIFVNVSLGEHVVTARDKNGCGEDSDTVIVMDYPKFFTPNGDGTNDTWNITFVENQPDALIYIYDRYGKLLKQLSPNGIGWNGTYKGNPLPSSDYWFSVEYNEPNTGERKEFKAHMTLKR